jgi:uncharacterized protein YfkK (UPF0435 family)
LAYDVIGVLQFHSNKKFDVLGFSYAHFSKAIRAKAHKHILQFLKPNGTVIFEAFSKAQLGKFSGGPKDETMLFSIDEIKEEFKELNFEFLEETTIDLKEGAYHEGLASIIRFVRKIEINSFGKVKIFKGLSKTLK